MKEFLSLLFDLIVLILFLRGEWVLYDVLISSKTVSTVDAVLTMTTYLFIGIALILIVGIEDSDERKKKKH